LTSSPPHHAPSAPGAPPPRLRGRTLPFINSMARDRPGRAQRSPSRGWPRRTLAGRPPRPAPRGHGRPDAGIEERGRSGCFGDDGWRWCGCHGDGERRQCGRGRTTRRRASTAAAAAWRLGAVRVNRYPFIAGRQADLGRTCAAGSQHTHSRAAVGPPHALGRQGWLPPSVCFSFFVFRFSFLILNSSF
jgi:hypothetical protein